MKVSKNNIMDKNNINLKVSVIMPTYNNVAWIRRAIISLLKQTLQEWELIIIDDGSEDQTYEYIQDLLNDERIKYVKNRYNIGLGACLNLGIQIAQNEIICYLPSDDYFYANHLYEFVIKFKENLNAILVYSGICFEQNDTLSLPSEESESLYIRKYYPLQLVQTAHKKTKELWLTRNEWVTDDLLLMFWNKLLDKGDFIATRKITCYWTQHPLQRHKIIGERYGGCLNLYRSFYKIKEPIKMRISKYKFINEIDIYKNFRTRNKTKKNSLKILIIGELSYNPERIYALEKAGHKLYGLWIREPRYSFANIGHLPFGNIEDIYYDNKWKEQVKQIKPDIIYALGNWDAIELAHSVLKANLNIPFVWHFKEGPQFCMRSGLWPKLCELYRQSDGKIFINELIRTWYKLFLGDLQNSFILDLDPPSSNYFKEEFSSKLSSEDNAIHTVVAGRLIGLSPAEMEILAKQNIHVHLYSESAHEARQSEYEQYKNSAPQHFHVHKHVSSEKWTEEFSKYDAGWLHSFDSHNKGCLINATWDDLNIPARIYTLVAAGIPIIQKDNSESRVAMQDIVKKYNIGVFYKRVSELKYILYNQKLMRELEKNLILNRKQFTFDFHIENLLDFFYQTINLKSNDR